MPIRNASAVTRLVLETIPVIIANLEPSQAGECRLRKLPRTGQSACARKGGRPSINFTFRPLDAGDCQKCHYGEFSRPFDWNEFWPLIKHGNEPKRATTTTALHQ